MNLLILGGNGRTGQHLVRKALDAGHRVTALVRRADALDALAHPSLYVKQGDVREPAQWASLLEEVDAVISVLGPRWPTHRAAAIYQDAAAALVPTLERAGVRRLIVTSSALLFPTDRLLIRLLRRFVPAIVHHASRMECEIAASTLDWTIARTTFLTDKPGSELTATVGRLPKDDRPVTRGSVAEYLLDAAVHRRHSRRIVGLTAPAAA